MRYPTGSLKQSLDAPGPTDAEDKTWAELYFSAAIIYSMVARHRLRRRWKAVSGSKTRMTDVCLTQTLTLVTADQTVKIQIWNDLNLNNKDKINILTFCPNNKWLNASNISSVRQWRISCARGVPVRLSASLVTTWVCVHGTLLLGIRGTRCWRPEVCNQRTPTTEFEIIKTVVASKIQTNLLENDAKYFQNFNKYIYLIFTMMTVKTGRWIQLYFIDACKQIVKQKKQTELLYIYGCAANTITFSFIQFHNCWLLVLLNCYKY